MSNEKYYRDKVVIITGSSMGIGKELAKIILHLGGKVVITGRNERRLKFLQKEFCIYHKNLLIIKSDVNCYDENIFMVNQTLEKFGRIDIIITNAGLSGYGEIENTDLNVAKKVIDTNIFGSINPVKVCLPYLIESKGSILFISSLAGFQGLPGYSSYSLSKMALRSLAQSLRIELKEKKVYVGIAYVGFTENDASKRTFSPSGDEEKVPQRPKWITFTRQHTAMKLLRQIRRKSPSKVHGIIGKISYRLNLWFPLLMDKVLAYSYKKQKQSKNEIIAS